MPTFFAQNLSFLRKKKGQTQAEVATALGLKRNTFSNYETTHSEPDLGTLEKIASFFDISIDELISVDLSKGGLVEDRRPGGDRVLRGMGLDRWGDALPPGESQQTRTERPAFAAIHLDGFERDRRIHHTSGDLYRGGRHESESCDGHLPQVRRGSEFVTSI